MCEAGVTNAEPSEDITVFLLDSVDK